MENKAPNPQELTVLFTGRYDPEYNRTLILSTGLKNLGVRLIEFPFTKKNSATKQQLRHYDTLVDFVFLPSFTHLDVAFVKRTMRQPVIFDPLISKFMTKVFDYKQVFRYSPRAIKNWLKDYISMHRADVVIADTQQHATYYQQVIKVDPQKIKVIPVGVDTDRFAPITRAENTGFKVGFYGSFIPLHGIDTIVKVARLLAKHSDIHFEIVGNGFVEKKIKRDVVKHPTSNLVFTDTVEYEKLSQKISTFDLCVGILGGGIKTQMVIPNKVFHYAACGKCIITRDTPAIREAFADRQDIILCDGTPEDLANKIQYLHQHPAAITTIAEKARQLVVEHYNQDKVAAQLIEVYYNLRLTENL